MKKTLFAGLIILLPIALTILVFVFLIDLFTAPFLDVVRNYIFAYQDRHHYFFSPEIVTIIARLFILICLIILTFLLGMLARWFLVHWILQITNKILSKIPFIKTIFKVTRDIASALFKSGKGARQAFRHTALAPFPRKRAAAWVLSPDRSLKSAMKKLRISFPCSSLQRRIPYLVI